MINDTIKHLPFTEGRASAWKNKVATSINASNAIAGSGIRVDYTSEGAVISLDVVNENLPIKYAGRFDINAEYYPNQIVRVDNAAVYRNQNNAIVPFGSTAFSSGSIIPISLGLFICVNYVPPAGCDEAWLNASSYQYPGGIPFNMVQATRFYSANVYYPVYPEIPTHYTTSYSVLGGASNILANNTFWVAMPCGTSAVTRCVNSVIETYYVMSFASGSSYLSQYLPYSG